MAAENMEHPYFLSCNQRSASIAAIAPMPAATMP
jgi:hypothetical protein